MTWKSSAISDMIADIIGLALTLDVDPNTAIAQQMMQPRQDNLNELNNTNRQSQPHPKQGNLGQLLPSKQAFEFILSEHFGQSL